MTTTGKASLNVTDWISTASLVQLRARAKIN